jgi:natural product biosynthesis luciferase-like monooxygenase protein
MKNVEDIYHLTPVQREMLDDARSAQSARVVQIGWTLGGELDGDAFGHAWQQVLMRHTALRTCFLSEQLEEPVQVVRQQVKLPFDRQDWTADAQDQQRQKLQEFLLADSRRGFDPARPPLFRLTQIRLDARSFQLVLSHHPLLLDERSAGLMFGEVLACYGARLKNSECPPAPAPLYRNYVGWVERQDLAGAELFWRKLSETGSLRPSLDTRAGEDGTHAFAPSNISRQAIFTAAATEGLKSFARREQLSFETLIASSWSLALMRDRGCRDLTIGVAARERPRGLPESEQMLGLLQNILPLPLSFACEGPVSSRLQEAERRRAGIQRYAHLSRAQINRWADVGTRQPPLFDGVALFHEPPGARAEDASGLSVGEAVRFNPGIDFPLVLEAAPGEKLSLTLRASRGDEPTVARLLDDVRRTLEHLSFPDLYLPESPLEAQVERGPGNEAASGGKQDGPGPTAESGAQSQQPERPLDFSLFYFADDNAVHGEDKYRLYLEGAKFADLHRFAAVWTPERHFHEKAGLYPNPSVLSAALAAITQHVRLRAGSVVLPLHNSLRVAEEWSVVDNLSKGRVGVSFTSGWMPNDFAFFPERYAGKREEMFRGMQEVQELWRGNPIAGRDGMGKEIELRIFPKPITTELPIWLTCSGGPEMFEKAGELGCHVLTALLTQSIEEVAPKIKLYRDSLSRHGHDPADGKVTMMMHTFVGDDAQAVLEKVRIPLTNYLKSHLNLIETGAQSLNLQVELDEEEYREKYQDQLAAFAFERYYRTASLIGTPTSCIKMIERLKAIGVDEVACLIDFGVDVDSVMESLSHLAVLKELGNRVSQPAVRALNTQASELV